MQPVGFFYDDVFLTHETPPWHPESKERLIHIVKALKDSGLWEKLIHVRPREARFEEIASVHTPEYVERVRTIGEGCLDPETHVSGNTWTAALHAAGALLEAAERCERGEFRRAFCAVRPPGHHAEAGVGMGFCIFNNIAVGARHAQKIGFPKVMIIDFDAHHGNGTQHIFEGDDSVFYFSTHQFPYYPDTGKETERGKGKGEGYTYNVAVKAGSGNKEYLYIYQDLLPDVVRRFGPDIVFVSAGYDIHVNDPHADIRVSGEGIRGIVKGILCSSSAPVIFTLEGGYDFPSLADSLRITIEEMLRNS